MKSLYEYISEAVKVSAWKAGYKLVELVSRDKVDCANLTKEEFYNLMIQDLETAQDEYSRLVYDERKRNIEAIKKRKMDYIEKLVQARYKRKSNQDAYREKLLFKQGGLTDYDLNRDVNISFDFITKIDVGRPYAILPIRMGSFPPVIGRKLCYPCRMTKRRKKRQDRRHLMMHSPTTTPPIPIQVIKATKFAP